MRKSQTQLPNQPTSPETKNQAFTAVQVNRRKCPVHMRHYMALWLCSLWLIPP